MTHDEAAEAMGVSRGQFIKLERNERQMTARYIEMAAKAFGVSNSEVISDGFHVPIMGSIGAGTEIQPEFDQVPPDGMRQVEIPFAVPPGIIGFEVQGDSMIPRFNENDVVLVHSEQRRAIHTFYGEEAAVRTADGRRFLKTIMREGDGDKTVTLLSSNARPITGVVIEWIGEIFAIIPASQFRRTVGLAAKRVRQ